MLDETVIAAMDAELKETRKRWLEFHKKATEKPVKEANDGKGKEEAKRGAKGR